MPVRLVLGVYGVVAWLILPWALIRSWWRSRRHPLYRGRLWERLGYGGRTPPGGLWVHAVSVGETRAAAPLVRYWLRAHPDCPIVLTTTTFTGADQVKTLFGNAVHHCFAPFDLGPCVRRFLNQARPREVVILETELWPTLFRALARRRIPFMLANARLSERSYRGYRRVAGVMRTILSLPQAIGAQGNGDARRLIALGADPDNVRVTGSMKFEIDIAADLEAGGRALRATWGTARPVWVAASTHAGEEEQVLEAHRLVRERHADALLILTPRHPERFAQAARVCAQRGFRFVRRSEGGQTTQAEVLLGDTMGELMLFFAACDCAFIGGSLVAIGGHNPLEAMAVARPVAFGPHMFNFADIADLALKGDAARSVASATELASTIASWLADPKSCRIAGAHGRALVRAHTGALARTTDLLEEMSTVTAATS